jgi:putative transposase
MYRILAEEGEVRERRDQLRHPHYRKPELLATAPNQVWSWDITKLRAVEKWTYFYLYVILDIFSRYVVGWMVAHGESTELAKRLIAETCEKQGIARGQLVIHSDRGTSMASKGVAQLLADLGVTKSHSRPHVSDDNPYSESQFKTLKYRADFPERFGGIEDACGFCRHFFAWYNCEHRHSGIGLMTPHAMHHGEAAAIHERRRRVLEVAYRTHPERFVRGVPKPPALPTAAWINPPANRDVAVIETTGSENEAHRSPRIDDLGSSKGVATPEFGNRGRVVLPLASADGDRLHTKFERQVSHIR